MGNMLVPLSTLFVVACAAIAGIMVIIAIKNKQPAGGVTQRTRQPGQPGTARPVVAPVVVAPNPAAIASARAAAGWALFEFPTTDPVPSFTQLKDVRLVGRTLGEAAVSECDKACHSNKYCSHWESRGNTCTLKNRQVVMADTDVDMTNLIGFDPLPECRGKKCMDGYVGGVVTGLHPNRMDFKPDGKSDNLEGYKKLADMMRQMHKAMTCDALCKFAKAFNIIGLVFMVTGLGGLVASGARAVVGAGLATMTRTAAAFVITDLTVAGIDIGLAVPNSKRGARNEKALQDAIKSVGENPTFMYHNIRGQDLENAYKGIECLQHCDLTPQKQGMSLMYGLAKLGAEKDRFITNGKRLQDQCCISAPGLLSPSDKKQCVKDTIFNYKPGTKPGILVPEFLVGSEKMCHAGNNMIDGMAWNKLPEAPNNYSADTFKYFKAKKVKDFL